MSMSELRKVIAEAADNTSQEVTDKNKNQLFGYVDGRTFVSFCGIEYSINTSIRLDAVDTIAPALIFDHFSERPKLEHIGDAYNKRHAQCLIIHNAIRKAGYTMTACTWHAVSEGDTVRCEYYKAGSDGVTSTTLLVLYAPTDYNPDGIILALDKQRKPMGGVYYTPGYEEGQLTYLSCSEFDGTRIRSIEITKIEDKIWKGRKMPRSYVQELEGLGVSSITSRTLTESQKGWKRIYTVILDSSEIAEIVVQNYHFTN